MKVRGRVILTILLIFTGWLLLDVVHRFPGAGTALELLGLYFVCRRLMWADKRQQEWAEWQAFLAQVLAQEQEWQWSWQGIQAWWTKTIAPYWQWWRRSPTSEQTPPIGLPSEPEQESSLGTTVMVHPHTESSGTTVIIHPHTEGWRRSGGGLFREPSAAKTLSNPTQEGTGVG